MNTTSPSTTTRKGLAALDHTFTAPVLKSANPGGWTFVRMPGSAEFFGTRGRVRIRGTVDGEPIRTSFMALGDGTHKLPVTTALLDRLGKDVGDDVTVRLEERIG
jgi:hypothetical protein